MPGPMQPCLYCHLNKNGDVAEYLDSDHTILIASKIHSIGKLPDIRCVPDRVPPLLIWAL